MPAWIPALIWAALPVLAIVRLRQSRSVREYEPARFEPPRLSIIVPARNEAHNIERCVRSLLSTTYMNAEFIVVDDHSADGTGEIAHRLVDGDPRARVTTPPPLPDGWFGKQWACAHGAAMATGDLLLFTDADTWHGPTLHARTVGAMQARGADLLTVVPRQEAVTFWEQVIQPQLMFAIFGFLGSTEAMSRTRVPRLKAANGQFLLMRRDVYEALDGHAAVREFVVEDIMFAQQWTAAGREVHAVLALDDMATRMYRSFDEIVRGWGKNIWAGGKHVFGENAWMRGMARVAAPLFPMFGLIHVSLFALGALGAVTPWWMWFGFWGYVFQTIPLAVFFRAVRHTPAYALLYPLGLAVSLYVVVGAVIRGDRIEWKGRRYMAG